MHVRILCRAVVLACLLAVFHGKLAPAAAPQSRIDFARDVAPVLERYCVRCHNQHTAKGEVALDTRQAVLESELELVVPGKPEESYLLETISPPEPSMPKEGPKLNGQQVELLRRWIAQGAPWPEKLVLEDRYVPDADWWAYKPLRQVSVPRVPEEYRHWVRTPVDAFVLRKLLEKGLRPSPEADRRELIRRLYFDLWGLPPTYEEVQRFVRDTRPDAYARLVDRLLASPHYGERWGRHWLDVAHYGDTHGFDKDKVRPNAWPYRDYVIRSLNQDKPYARFVQEQIAGDVLWPDEPDGVVGVGFLAAGPFDWVGQIEVRNGTMEKRRVRNLDRDDMVVTVFNTFLSTTVQCARCHNHKFDPVSQDEYYGLQAVFAGVDRADRFYDPDPQVARRRRHLQQKHQELAARLKRLDAQLARSRPPEARRLEEQIAQLGRVPPGQKKPPEYGYHSHIEPRPEVTKWVQVDLGRSVPIAAIIWIPCHDEFNGIGAGFGFPVQYRVEVSDDPQFKTATVVIDCTGYDRPNPGMVPQGTVLQNVQGRYVRITATRLALRRNDYIFALAELLVFDPQGNNLALGRPVQALDSIEAPVRWRKSNLVDGLYLGVKDTKRLLRLARLHDQLRRLEMRQDRKLLVRRKELEEQLRQVESALSRLPPQQRVFAAATSFSPIGNFVPTRGRPREVFVLRRGDVRQPIRPAVPQALQCFPWLPGKLELKDPQDEGQRRAALARWITHRENPLFWRSIVNRVWHYHFGRGIVETPNDFGRMGSRPTHPELLDWLAVWFRDNGQSLKALHRMILLSATYRQTSRVVGPAGRRAQALDAQNRWLWRANRRRLEAEALRDAVLAVSGSLNRKMGGPGFRNFGFKDDHSPHYKYHEYDPNDPDTHRRSVYRFIVRSVPDPFMEVLDCADPSAVVARRNETLTPLQALSLLNNRFMLVMARRWAEKLRSGHEKLEDQVREAFRQALARDPQPEELRVLVALGREHGLESVCRTLFNLNEFVFVD